MASPTTAFSGLPEQEAGFVPAGIEAAARNYRPGEEVIRVGEPGREMFVVLAGSAEALDPAGGEPTRIGPGEFFGEIALVDGGARLRTVRAGREGARLLPVDEARFVYLVSQQPAFALAVMSQLVRYQRGAAAKAPPAAAARAAGFRPVELMPGLIQLRSASRASNCYLIAGARRRVLVDVGLPSAWPDLEAALAKVGHPVDSLDLVVLTHEHADHAAAAGLLPPKVLVAAHPLAAAKIVNGDDLATVRSMLGEAGPPAQVDFLLEEGAVIAAPPWRFDVLHAPGHTSGSIALHDPGSGVLVAGDTVMAGGALGGIFASGNISDYVVTLDRLAALRPRLLLPGHGATSSEGEADLRTAASRARALLQETREIFAAMGAPASGLETILRSVRALAR